MKFSARILRLGIWLALSLGSLAMAWVNGLGYMWSGAWLRPLGVAVAAAYLPVFFGLAWFLIASSKQALIYLLWASSGVALLICVAATLLPDLYPLKVSAADFAVVLLLPLGGWLYRHLLNCESLRPPL